MKSVKKGGPGVVSRRGLFSKYFSMMMAFLLSIISVLGGVFLLFSARYFREDKETALFKAAESAARITRESTITEPYSRLDSGMITSNFGILADTADGAVFLINRYTGSVVYCTEGELCVHTTYRIPARIIEESVEHGYYAEIGSLAGIYTEREFTVALPVTQEDGAVHMVVFVSTSAATLDRYMGDILSIFVVASLSVFFIAFVCMYFATRSMVQPLINMAAATEQFARGDFTMRISVRGNDEIARLGQAFNEMAGSLATLENSRRSFIANVSHELKTPMTTIGGFIDGILDGTIPEERHDYYLRIVSEEVKRLARMVRSMLSLSRLDAGDMVIKPTIFDIRDVIVQAIFSFELPIEKKNVEINGLDGDKAMVYADRDLFHQVVYNLVENAVKFVNEGGVISFVITPEGEFTRVAIRNTGAGIARTELASVFERFYKTDRSRSLDKTGVGLGLYIVKSVVSLHGGSISVGSVEGEMTEFVFTVPNHPKKT